MTPTESELLSTAPPARWERLALRVVGPVFVVSALALVPWTGYLFLTLPERHLVAHYDLAWGGFDIMLIVALLATAWGAFRRSRLLPVAASALATLLVCDAWFDTVMAAGPHHRLWAIAMAALVELPLAVCCVWLAFHAQALRAHEIDMRWIRLRRKRLHRELDDRQQAAAR